MEIRNRNLHLFRLPLHEDLYAWPMCYLCKSRFPVPVMYKKLQTLCKHCTATVVRQFYMRKKKSSHQVGQEKVCERQGIEDTAFHSSDVDRQTTSNPENKTSTG